MAKKSKVVKERKRAELIAKHADRRRELKAIIKSHAATVQDREAAMAELHAMPADSRRTRARNRCQMTGRPRGFLRKFGLSRIAFRKMALEGEIPGVRKASW